MDPSPGDEGFAAYLPGPEAERAGAGVVTREEEEEELIGLYVLARAFYEVELRLLKLQDWVHSKLENKGYVEVNDEWYKRKANALE